MKALLNRDRNLPRIAWSREGWRKPLGFEFFADLRPFRLEIHVGRWRITAFMGHSENCACDDCIPF